MRTPIAIANTPGSTPRRTRTVHHAIASGRSAFGRTPKNCHSLRSRRRRTADGIGGASYCKCRLKYPPVMAHAADVVMTTRDERANQRNAVLAGFLGWTFDAFDFFVLTLVIDDVAKAFGTTRPHIAAALTATLAMRP